MQVARGSDRRQVNAVFFNEAEATIEITEAVGIEPELTATPLREMRSSETKAGRKALTAHLPRIEVRHELPAIERVCACGADLREIGAETSEQLDYIPAKIQVIRMCVRSMPALIATAA